MKSKKRCGSPQSQRLSRLRSGLLALGAALLSVGQARAQEVRIDLGGYIEGAGVITPAQQSSADGGLGKLRWGGTGSRSRVEPVLNEALLDAHVTLPGQLSLNAEVKFDTQQKSAVDLLDAALTWSPVLQDGLTTRIRLGAFFPPFGLENQDAGWTSPYTITSSALGSWVGEELRTIGSEAVVGWSGSVDSVRATAAIYGWNDPAGVIIADRGWILTNRSLGLFDQLRIPNTTAARFGERSPIYTPEFREIDGRPGWYAGASWSHAGLGRVQVYRYDNRADPAAERRDVYAWRTAFWEAGYTLNLHPFTLIAEGLTGYTVIAPGNHPFRTDFSSAYVLGAWTHDAWRTAIRLETFQTNGALSEHGWAATTAVNWFARDNIRLTGEVVLVHSTRSERQAAGRPATATEVEPQIALRFSF